MTAVETLDVGVGPTITDGSSSGFRDAAADKGLASTGGSKSSKLLVYRSLRNTNPPPSTDATPPTVREALDRQKA